MGIRAGGSVKLKDFIAKQPPRKHGPGCKVCALPKKMRAEANAALACQEQITIVWRWLRFDQKRKLSRVTVMRHARQCLKIRSRQHGAA